MVSEARPFPLAFSKDVMVEGHWCESTDATLSSFGMFAATSPAGTAGMKVCNLGYRVCFDGLTGGRGRRGRMWCAFPAAADPIAIEAHCMGFGVPAPSSLRKDPEEALTIRACRLFGLVRSRRGRQGGSFGDTCWRLKDETADRVDDGRALRAISLFSTKAMTSFTGV